MFSYELCEISKSTFFIEQLWWLPLMFWSRFADFLNFCKIFCHWLLVTGYIIIYSDMKYTFSAITLLTVPVFSLQSKLNFILNPLLREIREQTWELQRYYFSILICRIRLRRVFTMLFKSLSSIVQVCFKITLRRTSAAIQWRLR